MTPLEFIVLSCLLVPLIAATLLIAGGLLMVIYAGLYRLFTGKDLL